ncbi:hypothetical protein BUZ43_00635 [Staphylococcus haemolyticus]|uniref:hypothetical protein n=1 Tax=Staphylococcus haemolyticus TaxID=1283 RepID=UPI000D1E7351|nr:hypothetical protein [Staphylococcus haemolyticus]PTK51072.1 hypothetical protein BUZ43_00635 [Staphylococcus haemolyticus]
MNKKLSNAEKEILRRNDVSVETYNKRIKLGWNEDNALFLDNTFRKVGDHIYKTFYVKGKSLRMSPTNYYNMRSRRLNYEIVHTRLDNGIDMKDACTKHYGEYDCDIYTPEEIKQKNERQSRKASIDYTKLLFAQMMKNFISEEEYQACVKSR